MRNMKEYIVPLEFFSKILTGAPSREMLDHLAQAQIMNHWPVSVDDEQGARGLELIQTALQDDPHSLYKHVKEDYFLLFEMSPARCHVHESVWLSNDNLLYDEQTFAVRACYAKYGLQAVHSERGPDDHLGLELSFVAYLLNCYEEQTVKQRELLADIQYFMDEHLMKWGPECLEKINQEAETDFYRGVGLLLSSLLMQLADHIKKMSQQ